MAARTEITTNYASEYKKASKNKGAILNGVVAVTG